MFLRYGLSSITMMEFGEGILLILGYQAFSWVMEKIGFKRRLWEGLDWVVKSVGEMLEDNE